MNSSISCPNCHAQIEITEVISSQLRATIRGELEFSDSFRLDGRVGTTELCTDNK